MAQNSLHADWFFSPDTIVYICIHLMNYTEFLIIKKRKLPFSLLPLKCTVLKFLDGTKKHWKSEKYYTFPLATNPFIKSMTYKRRACTTFFRCQYFLSTLKSKCVICSKYCFAFRVFAQYVTFPFEFSRWACSSEFRIYKYNWLIRIAVGDFLANHISFCSVNDAFSHDSQILSSVSQNKVFYSILSILLLLLLQLFKLFQNWLSDVNIWK